MKYYKESDIRGARFNTISNPYSQGWNDGIDSILENATPIEAPTWIPVETREPDAEEREAICNIYGEAAVDDTPMFCGPMPEDGQEILISTPYGVYFDICSVDCEEGLNMLALENRGDWEDVTAWMPLPKPYQIDPEATQENPEAYQPQGSYQKQIIPAKRTGGHGSMIYKKKSARELYDEAVRKINNLKREMARLDGQLAAWDEIRADLYEQMMAEKQEQEATDGQQTH